MAFKNRVRLPFQLEGAQYPEERTVFRKADGTTQTMSAIIRKTYKGETDLWPERWHERFTIALSHDIVRVEGDRYLGAISKDGDYNIEWPEFLNYPTAKATFGAEVTPFDATNSNCQSCEEVSQVSLEDNLFPLTLEEDNIYTLNLITNDTICCSPVIFSLIILNTDVVLSASIGDDGVLTMQMQPSYESANGVELIRYRATCPNGAYDEATVFGNVEGTEEPDPCLAPTNIHSTSIEIGAAEFEWDAMPDAVSYSWELYSSEAPGSPVQTGSSLTNTLGITDLVTTNPVGYTLYVKTICADGESGFGIPLDFSNSYNTPSCGSYRFSYIGPPGNYGTPKPLNFIACLNNDGEVDLNGITRNVVIFHYYNVCLLESAPGVPVYWYAEDTIIEYFGSCL